MARYNVYKVKQGQFQALHSHLKGERSYKLSSSLVSEDYHVSFVISGHEPGDVWWLEQYESQFFERSKDRNMFISGAVLAEKKDESVAYVIPLGKTHFYIQDFIDLSFGLELAQRIADKNDAKMTALKRVGVRSSKVLTSFSSGSPLTFASAESAEYLKLRAENKEKWGNAFIHFGSSVQVNSSEILPENIGELLSNITEALLSNPRFPLPLMKEVQPEEGALLNAILANKILDLDRSIGFIDYEIYGVEFVFSQQTHVRIRYKNIRSEPLAELTIEHVANFANANGINLHDSLLEIGLEIHVGDQRKYTPKLLKLIEYCDEQSKAFLLHGKWFHFNESFMQVLRQALVTVPVTQFPLQFSKDEFLKWQALQIGKVKYRERFVVLKVGELLGYEVLDRELDYHHVADQKKVYPFEVGDLYDAEKKKIIVAKIGDPGDFGYAFDQAVATLSMVETHTYTSPKGERREVREIEILLLFKSPRKLGFATDTKSFMFELKLNDLRKLAQEKDVVLGVSYSNIL